MQNIGVPEEHKNIFERRVAVTPAVSAKLTKHGVSVFVQRSKKRAFKEKEYTDAGARVVEQLNEADLFVGVKEPPVDMVDGKIHMMFSHTLKGQAYNMPLLKRFLDTGATLIDYELITDSQGKRLVAFGRFAGIAGMNDALWTLGQKLEAMGIKGPFSKFRPASMHTDLVDLFGHLKRLGKTISEHGIPGLTAPLVIGITGYGRVGQGSREVLHSLGATQIEPEEVSQVKGPGLFFTMFEERHMFRRADNGFDLQEYYGHPEIYHSVFEEYLPKLTVLMNSIYWEPRYPRLVTREFIKKSADASEFRLQVIGDTSCDPQGSCEITDHCTGPGNPAFTYLPDEDVFANGIIGAGITVFAVENLPAEVPVDSSIAFANALYPHLLNVAKTDFNKSFDALDLPVELKRAIIVLNGELTPDFQYLKAHLEKDGQ